MKFKVGDRVKVRSDLIAGQKYGRHNFIDDMGDFMGKIVTIESVYNNCYHIKEDDGWGWTDEMLEPNVVTFTKSNLENGMVVEYRNGKRRMVLGNKVIGIDGCMGINRLNDTLEHRDDDTFTIDKVYKSNSHSLDGYFKDYSLELIWERPAKKMTIEEIEKELGYKIEIVTKD